MSAAPATPAAVPLAALGPVLIANRGEIACRIARTLARLGLEAVAVASDADRDAPHVRACARCVPIGGLRPADSYLRAELLLEAARASGARAVHPGYGFLSENAAFAEAVQAAGLVWIGPPPAAMRALGDKAAGRARAAALGVPVLPGYQGAAQDLPTLEAEARALGLPLMIKAAAGGGGRGMRLVTTDEALPEALARARSEAEAAFGDGRLVLERALLAPRHVEIQIVADRHGGAIHLGERDCSVQRRHQKLVEEAPSPAVDAALRRRIGDAALRLARDVGYVGAGTLEFLLDAEAGGAFWFMEMNARLQVEHPVTEALLGIDLVEWQLRIAAGEPLPLTQHEALARYESAGHAIEVRLCAEDARQQHLPQAGRLLAWQAPPPAQVRCDHALASGIEVSPYYDSMLAKLIAHAPTRDAARLQLARALDATHALGLATNRALLAALLREAAVFGAGLADTGYLAHHGAALAERAAAVEPATLAAALALAATWPAQPLPAAWAGWLPQGRLAFALPFRLAGETEPRQAQIELLAGETRVSYQDQMFTCRISAECGVDAGAFEVQGADAQGRLHGRRVSRLAWARAGMRWHVQDDGGCELVFDDLRLVPRARHDAAASGRIEAPMHGRVVAAPLAEGSMVQAGQVLLVLEAMKMEHALAAPKAGRLARLHVAPGAQVAARQLLAEID